MSLVGRAKPAKLAVKHELEKPDSFMELMGNISLFVQKNKKAALVSVGIFMAFLGIRAVYNYVVTSELNSASLAEYRAEQVIKGDFVSPTGKIDNLKVKPGKTEQEKYKLALKKYQELLSDYAGTPVGERAALGVANCFFKLGNYAEAAKAYQEYIDKHPNSDFVFLAKRNLALSLESKGSVKEALKVFKASVGDAKHPALSSMAYLDLGRIYQTKNETKEALAAYKSFLASTLVPETLKEEIEKKVASLELELK